MKNNFYSKSILAFLFFSISIYSAGLIIYSDYSDSKNLLPITDNIDENQIFSSLSAPISSSSTVSTQSMIIDDFGFDSAYNIVSYDVSSHSQLNLNYVTSSATSGSSSPLVSPINWTDVVTTTRTLIPNTTSFLPYKATTRIYGSSNAGAWVGSGFMVAPNIMITAGHCVYNDNSNDGLNNPTFASYFRIYPGQNGAATPYGTTYAKRIYISKEYYLNSTGYDYDLAIVKTTTSIGNSCGYFGME